MTYILRHAAAHDGRVPNAHRTGLAISIGTGTSMARYMAHGAACGTVRRTTRTRRGPQHAARLSAHSTVYGAPEHFYPVIDQVVSNAASASSISNAASASHAASASSASNAANAAIPPFRPLGSSFASAPPSQAVSCIRFAASHRRPRRIGLCAPDTIRPASRMPDTKADRYHGR